MCSLQRSNSAASEYSHRLKGWSRVAIEAVVSICGTAGIQSLQWLLISLRMKLYYDFLFVLWFTSSCMNWLSVTLSLHLLCSPVCPINLTTLASSLFLELAKNSSTSGHLKFPFPGKFISTIMSEWQCCPRKHALNVTTEY